jgi:tetratricopeptide (TPR) repeat protein
MMALTTDLLSDTNLPTQVAFQLATVLYGGRQFERMDEVLELCMARMPANSPPEIYLSMARMYLDAQMPQKMVVCLQRYLQINPGDWKAWLDMAYIFMTVNQHDAALRALNQARQVGGAEADALVTSDDRFAPLLQRSAPTSVPGGVNLLGLPGASRR